MGADERRLKDKNMRSVVWALTWECWRKRSWYIILFLLMWIMWGYISGVNIKHAEKRYLRIKEYYQNLKIEDPDDYQWAKKQLEENTREYKSSVNETYHFFLFYLIISLGSIMLGDTKKNKIRLPERLFTLPITTNSLVARIFLYEMIFITILSFVLTVYFGFSSGKTVSVFGISLFTTTAIITFQSFLWLAISAPLPGIPLLLVMSFGLFMWFAIQHQFLIFSGMDIIWEQLEPDQAIFMFFCIILSYILAVKAVSLDRIKENLSISELNEHLDHKIRSFFLFRRGKFKSPSNAHFWFVWQRHGFLMPFIIFFFMIEFIILFSVSTAPSASLSDIFNIYFFVILILLSLFWGSLIAKTKTSMTDFDLGTFEATRPLSSRDISYAILKNGLVDIFLCGFVLIFSILLGMALNYFLGNGALISDLGRQTIEINLLNLKIQGIKGLVFILSGALLVSWILMGISSVLTLTGSRFIYSMFWMISFLILFIFYHIINEIFFPFLGSVLTLEIAFLFIMAKRRNLIEKKDILTNLTLWAIGSVILILVCYTDEIGRLDLAIFASGIMALALAPFALAPMALHGNRHR